MSYGSWIVLGSQWGDEGKGKVVDFLTHQANAVVRYQGGHNAGHTLIVQGKKIVLHLIPSGILHPQVKNFIGQGVVVFADALAKEIESLKAAGIDTQGRIFVSAGCPLILPSHRALDIAREEQKGEESIGTTRRGIGPAYEDKIARRGLRVIDLLETKNLKKKLADLMSYHNFLLKEYYQQPTINVEQTYQDLIQHEPLLREICCDVPDAVQQLSQTRARIIFEGAQGALLDIDHGTYPFVTSSNTLAGAASTGVGMGPNAFHRVIGVVKAYSTRVGSGPFPTELQNEVGAQIAKLGNEFGSTTGRQRRCGWLDLVALKRAVQLNGMTELCLTKLDVLDSFAELKMCTYYLLDGKHIDRIPISSGQINACTPQYQCFEGWQCNTAGISSMGDLPLAAQKYIEFISNFIELPISLVSTGPSRHEMIIRDEALVAA